MIELDDGLVGLWRFDEMDGQTAIDESEYGNHGTVTSAEWTTHGKSGGALEFDGSSGYVDCCSDPSLAVQQSGWTFSAWIYPLSAEALSPYRNSIYVAGPNAWWIVLDSNDIVLQQMTTPWAEVSAYGNEIQNNNWYHVLITSNGDEKKIYINGTNVATSNLTISDATIGKIAFGYTSTDCFNGTIDEVRLYNRVLNSNEIEYLYANPDGIYTNLEDGLILHLPFSEGYGNSTTNDESTNSNDGTLNNIDDNNWTNGACGTALEFNGVDEFINCGNDTSLDFSGGFSISVWIKLNDHATGCGFVLCKRGTTDTDMEYGVMWSDTSNALKCGFENVWRGSTSPNAILPGRWYHVGIVYNQVDVRYYVNGFLDEVPYLVSGSISSTTHDLIVGKCNPANCHFDGIIDEIRVYNRNISATEIKALHKTPCIDQGSFTSHKLIVTDVNGNDHEITDDIQNIDLDYVLSDGADTFSFTITNELDQYSYIEKGCQIRIMYGIGGANEIRLVGIINDANKTLESELVVAMVEVSGEDWTSRLNHIYFTDRFYDMEISDIVKAILNSYDYTTGKTYRELAGINDDDTHINCTAFTLGNTSFVWSTLSSALKELAGVTGYEWYVDVQKRIHFYDPEGTSVSNTITDDDIHGVPVIGTYKEIVNRAIVIGGYKQAIDLIEGPYTILTPVTINSSHSESFIPTENFLSGVFVYTDLRDASSNMILSIQNDDAGSPSGINMPNGHVTINHDVITDGGYTEFRFDNHVTVTPGEIYHMVIHGTTLSGVNVRVDASNNLDYNTRFPYRIAIMSNDVDSQDDYEMFTAVHRDEGIEDEAQAELIAEELLNGYPNKTADIMVYGTDVGIGDMVRLTISKVGIAIDKNMKVISNSHSVGQRYIYSKLGLKEL